MSNTDNINSVEAKRLRLERAQRFTEGNRVRIEVVARGVVLEESTHYVYTNDDGDLCVQRKEFELRLKDVSITNRIIRL